MLSLSRYKRVENFFFFFFKIYLVYIHLLLTFCLMYTETLFSNSLLRKILALTSFFVPFLTVDPEARTKCNSRDATRAVRSRLEIELLSLHRMVRSFRFFDSSGSVTATKINFQRSNLSRFLTI